MQEKIEITGLEVRSIGWMMIKHLPAELLQEIRRAVCGHRPATTDDEFRSRYAVCIQKLNHRSHFIVGGCKNMSLHLQPGNDVRTQLSSASSHVMSLHYFSKYMQSLQSINGLIAEGRVGNLLCGRPSQIAIPSTRGQISGRVAGSASRVPTLDSELQRTSSRIEWVGSEFFSSGTSLRLLK